MKAFEGEDPSQSAINKTLAHGTKADRASTTIPMAMTPEGPCRQAAATDEHQISATTETMQGLPEGQAHAKHCTEGTRPRCCDLSDLLLGRQLE